jgi:hypothetical protein
LDRCAAYLGDANWDRNWAPAASSSDDDGDDEDEDEDDFHEHDGHGCADVQVQAPSPPPPRVSGEVSGQIYNGQVIRDDTDDIVRDMSLYVTYVT